MIAAFSCWTAQCCSPTSAARHYWRLVVPAVAVRQLDQWKKGEREAREAIRWAGVRAGPR